MTNTPLCTPLTSSCFKESQVFYDLVKSDADNLEQGCANFHRNITGRGATPKATHYHRVKNSWVCFGCAQSINRDALQRHLKWAAKDSGPFKPVCIPGPEAMIMLLQQSHSNA